MIFFRSLLILLAASLSLAAQTRFSLYEKSGLFRINPWARYNKVDGGLLGFSGNYFFNDHLSMEGRAGYAFAGKFPRFGVDLKKTLESRNDEYSIIAGYFRDDQTGDASVLPDWQNSLSSLLFKNDYYNQYEVRGGRITLGGLWDGTYRVTITGVLQNYYSLSNAAQFSVSNWGADHMAGQRRFAVNPPVAEGRDIFIAVNYGIDTRPSPLAFVNAWVIDGNYSNSAILNRASKSDFSYQRMDLNITRYQKLFARQKSLFHVRLAAHEGARSFIKGTDTIPSDQFLFDAGGYGSLRGYSYRELSNGNRLAIVSWDYFFNGSFLPRTPLAKIWGVGRILKAFDLILIADAGQVWSADENLAWIKPGGVKRKNFKASAGAGLAMSDWIRIEWAWPLVKTAQTPKGDYAVYFRFTPRLN